MNGAHAIIETLLKQGCDVTFGYPGGAVIPLFDAYLDYKGKIRNILVRHEQCAAHAAEGYAKASGKVGVCIATSGPGATNLVTGIMDAYMDNIPIVALGGQVPTKLIGNDAFQESDMMGITIPITKHNFQARSADDLAPMIMKSFMLAGQGRPGPVYIDLPKDTQIHQVTKPFPKEVKIEGFCPTFKPNNHQLKKAVAAIAESKKPLFLIGGGAVLADADKEFAELSKITKIPVTTTLQGKGIFDEDNDLSLGIVGMHGRKCANYATINTDLLISIGCRFSDRITGSLESYMKNVTVIHADVDPAEIGKNVHVDIPIVGDAREIIQGLVDAIKSVKLPDWSSWRDEIHKMRDACESCTWCLDKKKIHPRMIIEAMNKIIKKDDIVVTGVGQHQMFAMHYLKRYKPRTFISSGGAGTMGFGFPAAIGAKVAKPEKEVFLIDGDGSFQMTLQELGTVAEAGIKVIIMIFNNSYLGMVRQWLEIYHDKRYSQVHLGKGPDFVKIAEAYGLKGINVSDPAKIDSAIKEAIKSDVTTLINFKMEEESNVLPMLPPGGHVKDAFGGCMKIPGQFI
ncbi:MAG: biosynthetic-type acetolactate synthase large subunit [Nanoarchaeota archaeon]|nr:biosynthetic-type acetolactate synthase large subunit [Nanoarchaeota archaeon]